MEIPEIRPARTIKEGARTHSANGTREFDWGQERPAIPRGFDDVHPYQFVIHDRDSIFSAALDAALNDFGRGF